jgi:uncharacterized protein
MNKSLSTREHFADELRGFALLGIVLVNAPFFGISGHGFTSASLATQIDQFAAFFTVAFAQAKFYLLFSFLFGYSLSFLIKTNHPDSTTRFRRRLIGLALLGAAHAVFFFIGDILLLYAAVGCVLLWLIAKKEKVIGIVAFASITVWFLAFALILVAVWFAPADDGFLSVIKALDTSLQNGTFVDAAKARFLIWPQIFLVLSVLNGLGVLAMFCIGLIAGRHRLLADPAVGNRLWRCGSWCGFVLGLPAALASAYLAVGQGAQVCAKQQESYSALQRHHS